MNNMTSSISGVSIIEQTTENTTPPHEAPQTSVPQSPPKKSTGFTKEMRDAKIAAGWIPPEKRVKDSVSVGIGSIPQSIQEQHEAEVILERLVAKMVALENNGQYQSMWTMFFQHGGVYTGPNYVDELRVACDFLNARKISRSTE
jgi:hypothetical protein